MASKTVAKRKTASPSRSGGRTRPLATVESSGGPRNAAEFRQSFPEFRESPEPAAAPAAPSVQRETTNQDRLNAARQAVPAQKVQRSNYQPIILMEYVGCLLLTVTTPVATKKQANGLSPYAGADMVKIAAITLLYFILAAISVGGRGPGRFAAWFGGLILIVDGMYEASNLAKDFGLFTGGLAAAASGAGAVPGQPAPAVGVNNPSLVQNVINAATNPPGFGQ